jgi:hypothetical protein
MQLIAIIPKRDHIHLEIGYNNRIVDVMIKEGKIANIEEINEPVQEFVTQRVLPHLKNWIGWKYLKKHYSHYMEG